MRILIHWLLSAASLLLIAYVLPLGMHIQDFKTALIAALVLGILNVFLKPILKILTLPINIVTLGLFGIVLNGLIFWLAASFVSQFEVRGFWWALIAAVLYSIANQIIDIFVGHKEEEE